ncbi:sensor histidine kinase [Streptomyces sp. CBMA152]|uniref:sensor histidine kinase n=1 Tax=Streptomyces sp. CBMA152 TaxID=1896312 RepID=UPI0016603A51|nr:hypothetical protein [Streptomyces sp. CBMA152]MBD0742212.1 hypothetical protein [Streptomyces sp. CBMA152]
MALAQAARFVARQNPQAALDTLAWIEEAGQRALRSMDETVHMLRTDEDDDGRRHAVQGLGELPELVERLASSSSARVHLEIAAGVDAVRREVVATVHRVVVEALTNVRRHAPDASEVRGKVARTADALTVEIVDDGTEQLHGADVVVTNGRFSSPCPRWPSPWACTWSTGASSENGPRADGSCGRSSACHRPAPIPAGWCTAEVYP